MSSTPPTTNGRLTEEPTACEQCGTPFTGGRFCPECGHRVAAGAAATRHDGDHDEASSEVPLDAAARTPFADDIAARSASGPDEPTAVHRAPAGAPRFPAAPQRSSKRALIAGLFVGLVLLAGGIAALFLLTSSDGTDADTAYKQKVATTFGPVLGANRQVSDALARLRGTRANSARAADARVAVRRVRQATTLATGAIGALNVPAGSGQLARDTRQALDRESAYHAEVARVLARPATTSTGSLQTLASNLTSALSVAGPTVAGTEPTVSGTDRLVAWARAIRVKANAKKKQPTNPQGNGTTPAPSTAPASRGTECGGGLFAGPNTSCAFALNVRSAYMDAPGARATVRVFSPVTDQTYTMNCAPSGSGITCSGANDASVSFDL
jgi:hypothetical protein